MNGALVYLDRFVGAISRYEIVGPGEGLRRTHGAVLPLDIERPILFDAAEVARYVTNPPGDHYLRGPAPTPGGDEPGGTPAAAAMARAA